MELSLRGRAKLVNLNLRREHAGEELQLGVDLKLTLPATADELVYFGSPLRSMLYEGQSLRMPQLEPLKLSTIFEDHALHIAAMSFDGVTFSKFVLAPQPESKVEITFNASITNLDPGALPELGALLLEDTCSIETEAAQGELFKTPTEPEPA